MAEALGGFVDNLLEKLANMHRHSNASEKIKLLSKQAARMYVEKEADSLNDAVLQAVDGEELNREQVSRVAEMANQATWNALFRERGEDASFAPASSDDIIGSMAVRPEEITTDAQVSDYYSDVPSYTVDSDIESIFGKTASAEEYERLDPLSDLASAEASARTAVEQGEAYLKRIASAVVDAGESFYKTAKQVALDEGLGILDIADALRTVFVDGAFGADVLKKTAARFKHEGVPVGSLSMQKEASFRVVNQEHPLIKAASRLEAAANSYYTLEHDTEVLRRTHAEAYSALVSKARGR